MWCSRAPGCCVREGIVTGDCATAVLLGVALLLTDWDLEAERAQRRASEEQETDETCAALADPEFGAGACCRKARRHAVGPLPPKLGLEMQARGSCGQALSAYVGSLGWLASIQPTWVRREGVGRGQGCIGGPQQERQERLCEPAPQAQLHLPQVQPRLQLCAAELTCTCI